MQQQPPRELRPSRAVRLTFSFGPEGVRLIDRQIIEKRVPPADALPAELDATTLAAEVVSARGGPNFVRVIPQAIPVDVEVFDPGGEVHRDPSPPERGVFTALVPDDPDAMEIVLLAREPDRGPIKRTAQEGGRPVEYGRFSLRPDDKIGLV